MSPEIEAYCDEVMTRLAVAIARRRCVNLAVAREIVRSTPSCGAPIVGLLREAGPNWNRPAIDLLRDSETEQRG